jgi:hypothetical protein
MTAITAALVQLSPYNPFNAKSQAKFAAVQSIVTEDMHT